MSFLEDENEMVVNVEMQIIADQLLDDWIQNNLDEGQLYSDWRIADMCDSKYLKERFNLFYNLTPEDNYYIEVE